MKVDKAKLSKTTKSRHVLKQSKGSLSDLFTRTQQQQFQPFQTVNRFNLKNSSAGTAFSQTPGVETPPILYDEFIYTDKLTNKKIKMRDAKSSYENGRHMRNTSNTGFNMTGMSKCQIDKSRRTSKHLDIQTKQNIELKKESSNLDQCMLLLKSTEMFKMNSLRQKIFGSVDRTSRPATLQKNDPHRSSNNKENIDSDLRNVMLKKKKIRNILQNSVKQANLKEFRAYYEDDNHRPNRKIISMNRHLPRSFTKSNLEKIIGTLETAENPVEDLPNFLDFNKQDIKFPGEDKFRVDLIQKLRCEIKSNGQYLIEPPKEKLLYERIFSNVNRTEKLSTNFAVKKPRKTHCHTKNLSQTPHSQAVASSIASINEPSHYNTTQDDQSEDFQRFTNPTQSEFLKQYNFKPCRKLEQINQIKQTYQQNQELKEKRLKLEDRRFLFMVENGFLFDVEKQILMNQSLIHSKDKKDNGLLHISCKNRYTEMFEFVIEKMRKTTLAKKGVFSHNSLKHMLEDVLFHQRNKNNKSAYDLASFYQAIDILKVIENLRIEFDLKIA